MEVFGGSPRYTTYPTRDGKRVAVCLLEAKIWRRFCAVIGRHDLAFADETPVDRLSSHGPRAELFRAAIAEFCLARDRDEIGALMVAHALPVMPVLTPDEAVASPHAASRGVVEEVEHPTEGTTYTLRSGLKGSGLVRETRRSAPTIGDAERAPPASRIRASRAV
jgi:crotonobetainyl-CoA:carnitine CoA-transferase CaiB-like acyl-CoA transferase